MKMIDYIVKYSFWTDDIEITKDKTITVEQYIEDNELLKDVIFEKLKDYLEVEDIDIVEFNPVNQRDNLYRFTEDDVYFDYGYQADYN